MINALMACAWVVVMPDWARLRLAAWGLGGGQLFQCATDSINGLACAPLSGAGSEMLLILRAEHLCSFFIPFIHQIWRRDDGIKDGH